MQEIANKKPKWKIFFDEENHKFIDSKSRPIQSVTEIIGVIDKSDFLVPWAVKMTIDYLDKNWDFLDKDRLLEEAKKEHYLVKRRAGAEGTEAHEWISGFVGGVVNELPENDNVVNAIQAFLKWRNKENITSIASEKIVFSQTYNFAGILDELILWNDKKYIVDYKTSKSIYKSFEAQLAGYQLAYEEMTGDKIDGRIIIHLCKETGKFKIKILTNNDRSAFLSALNLSRWLKN